MSRPIVIVGSGGHAKVVVSTCRAAGREVKFAVDSDAAKLSSTVLGVPVVTQEQALELLNAEWLLAFGSNRGRFDFDKNFGRDWATVVHPGTHIDPSVILGEGTVVFAGTVVQPEARIGRHVILNTSCSVDHDCEIGDYCHVGPGARLCGAISVGEGALLGVGSNVRPGVTIGAWATLGAGSTAIGDLDGGFVYAGVPARRLHT